MSLAPRVRRHRNLPHAPGAPFPWPEPGGAAPDEVLAVHRGLPGYRPTPLHSMPAAAPTLGVGALLVKDESRRFGLNAFKGLGASYAMHRLAQARPGIEVFCTASEGNHGRAVAWAARTLERSAVVFLPGDTAPARLRAIREEGGRVELVEGDYEAAVARARAAADREGWILVQDTAWEGYTEIPARIMQGYTTAVREVEEALGPRPEPGVDLVLVQGGVGSWAASVAACYGERYGDRAPALVVVEPTAADCLLESALQGRPSESRGSRRTVMAGLNCGVPSLLAVRVLRERAALFLAVDDPWAERAVGLLTAGAGGDPQVPSSPAGAAGLAGLLALREHPELREAGEALGLGPESRVLVFNTEGAWG